MTQPNSTHPIHAKITHLHDSARDKLAQKHQKAWTKVQDTKTPIHHFVSRSKHVATSAVLAGSLFMPKAEVGIDIAKATQPSPVSIDSIAMPTDPNEVSRRVLKRLLTESLPEKPKQLDTGTADMISTHIASILNIHAVSELEGYKLNTDYGYMGAEQHLPRFAGDTIAQHDEYQQSGITKYRGAFGYFANSKAELGEEEILQEKYYMVVQSFLSPGWNQNSRDFKEWLKFRKVIAVNTETGKAVVGVIGDAGPALWTGKQYGGSPEVIRELNLGKHSAKTKVILLFVEDPENKIPLGPVN